jgi:hypothetical protein
MIAPWAGKHLLHVNTARVSVYCTCAYMYVHTCTRITCFDTCRPSTGLLDKLPETGRHPGHASPSGRILRVPHVPYKLNTAPSPPQSHPYALRGLWPYTQQRRHCRRITPPVRAMQRGKASVLGSGSQNRSRPGLPGTNSVGSSAKPTPPVV